MVGESQGAGESAARGTSGRAFIKTSSVKHPTWQWPAIDLRGIYFLFA
jgi:hypothetical protein